LRNEKCVLILTPIVLIGLIQMNLRTEYDERCDLKEYVYNNKSKKIEDCPFVIYLQIQM